MEKGCPGPWPRVSRRMAGLLASLLALTVVFIDAATTIHFNGAIVYGLPPVVAAATRSRRLLWALALSLVLSTFIVYSVQISSGAFSPGGPLLANRTLAALSLVLTAGLLHVGLGAVDVLEGQRRSLGERNAELDRRRREAEEAIGRKNRLLAALSHDIRTPIQTIRMMSEVLRRTADHPEPGGRIPDLAHGLQANALVLADLVGDVLDAAHCDGAGGVLSVSEFSLDDLLDQECARALPLAQMKGLRLEMEAPAVPLRLRTDRVKLVRIVGNLLGNAIKYTDEGGVTVRAELAPDRAALIRVRDTGVGIAAEELERIFDEFVQLRNPEGDRGKGCGLGLAICRRLVEAAGGRLTVESEPGQGSAFAVRLPPSCVVEVPGDVQAQPRGARPCRVSVT